jgi:hypothetical protein
VDEIRELASAEFAGVFAGDRPKVRVQLNGVKLEGSDPDAWADLARAAATACAELIQARSHLAHEAAVRLNEPTINETMAQIREKHGDAG